MYLIIQTSEATGYSLNGNTTVNISKKSLQPLILSLYEYVLKIRGFRDCFYKTFANIVLSGMDYIYTTLFVFLKKKGENMLFNRKELERLGCTGLEIEMTLKYQEKFPIFFRQ